MNYILPKGVRLILDTLQKNGAEGYLVGGCVRDMLRKQLPKDYDIAASVPPEKLLQIFSGYTVIETGIKHGTITVIIEGEGFEVTSYRTDGSYSDGRHPDSVRFGTSLFDDLGRRDFTINAMAYHPEAGIIDLFGGEADLENKMIRTVGLPQQRFREDALRILRGVRFVSQLGFSMEKSTKDAAIELKENLSFIAKERIFGELVQMLIGDSVESVLSDFAPVIFEIIPELAPTYEFPQRTKYHKYDVWRHIAATVGAVRANPALRLTMLLHDSGKPYCHTEKNGKDHFKGHPAKSAAIAEEVLTRLRCDNKTRNLVVKLIKYHDVRPGDDERKILRLLHALGKEDFFLLLECQRADAAGKADVHRVEQLKEIEGMRKIAEKILEEGKCFRISDLDITGEHLVKLGLQGPEVGKMLSLMLDKIMDGELVNEKEKLLEFAQKMQ